MIYMASILTYSPIHSGGATSQSDAAINTFCVYNCSKESRTSYQGTKGSHDQLTWHTLDSSIFSVGTVSSVVIILAFNQSGLIYSTEDINNSNDDGFISSKVRISESSCICGSNTTTNVALLTQLERVVSLTFSYSIPEPENPSCLQATLASAVVQPSSHTVPQSPFRHTSTLPLKLEDPFLSLMLPWEHPVTQILQCY